MLGPMLKTQGEKRPAPPESVWQTLLKHYDGKDRFYMSAIGIMVGTDPRRREIVLADFEQNCPEWNEKVADLVW